MNSGTSFCRCDASRIPRRASIAHRCHGDPPPRLQAARERPGSDPKGACVWYGAVNKIHTHSLTHTGMRVRAHRATPTTSGSRKPLIDRDESHLRPGRSERVVANLALGSAVLAFLGSQKRRALGAQSGLDTGALFQVADLVYAAGDSATNKEKRRLPHT